MSNVDKRMREAFEGMHASDELKKTTMQRIEQQRAEASCETEPMSRRRNGLRSRRLGSGRRTGALIAAVACLLAVFVGAGGYAYAMKPVAYVGVDINPSIELVLNRFDCVIEARALNDDARAVLDAADVKGMSYAEAADALADACRVYLGEDALVEVGVACSDPQRCAEIEEESLRSFGRDGSQVHCGRVDETQREAACHAGMSLGRYRLYSVLEQAGVDLTLEEASSLSMRELRALAAENEIETHDSACCGDGFSVACSEQSGGACAQVQGEDSAHHGQGEGNGSGASQGHASRDGQGYRGGKN